VLLCPLGGVPNVPPTYLLAPSHCRRYLRTRACVHMSSTEERLYFLGSLTSHTDRNPLHLDQGLARWRASSKAILQPTLPFPTQAALQVHMVPRVEERRRQAGEEARRGGMWGRAVRAPT
jgi:hypothetical protein